jgi:ATP-dependent Lhr-like helicase
MPSERHVVLERFFDESGGMQLVIHAPFGSRINRAWGLALRKRFCRRFNFELQAAATDDSVILSLGESHSFPIEDVMRYLSSQSARDVLIQALLAAPLFTARWRWVCNIALAIPRFRSGKKVPAPIQRMQAEDLTAHVFPDQIACAENLAGPREIPDHPLVTQTLHDCLHEAMDIDGLLRILRGIEAGDIAVSGRELTEPSPFAQEILSAKPYAFLDDAPLEERRTQAVAHRRYLKPEEAASLGQLSPQAIAQVRSEITPVFANADELHDALLTAAFLTEDEVETTHRGPSATSDSLVDELLGDRRAAWMTPPGEQSKLLVATERAAQIQAIFDESDQAPDALVDIVASRLGVLGPTTAATLGAPFGTALTPADIAPALIQLQTDGTAIKGSFERIATDGLEDTEQWCERRILARIHRQTIKKLRQSVEPVTLARYVTFLFDWQGLTDATRVEGQRALFPVLDALTGYVAPAEEWESTLLPSRVAGYEPEWLDGLGATGRVVWFRDPSSGTRHPGEKTASLNRRSPIVLCDRTVLAEWLEFRRQTEPDVCLSAHLGPAAQQLYELLERERSLFFDELVSYTARLTTQVEDALRELVGASLATSDTFAGLRALAIKGPAGKRSRQRPSRRRGRYVPHAIEEAGRWSLLDQRLTPRGDDGDRGPASWQRAEERAENWARILLERYGVVWRALVKREPLAPAWRDLVRALRRLEDRGEVRGGLFVAGFSGEQFALPEAVSALRKRPRGRASPAAATAPNGNAGEAVVLGINDPANMLGNLIASNTVRPGFNHRIRYVDGRPAAALIRDRWVTLDMGQDRTGAGIHWPARPTSDDAPSTGFRVTAP